MYVMYRVCILSSNSSYELSTIYMHSMHVYYKLSYVAVRIIESSIIGRQTNRQTVHRLLSAPMIRDPPDLRHLPYYLE